MSFLVEKLIILNDLSAPLNAKTLIIRAFLKQKTIIIKNECKNTKNMIGLLSCTQKRSFFVKFIILLGLGGSKRRGT